MGNFSQQPVVESPPAVAGNDPARSADGIVGPLVVEQLVPDGDVAVLPPDIGDLEQGPQARRAVAVALHQQGRRESPCGSNRNPYSAYFGFGPQFWCADFVSWCFDVTGDRDRNLPWGAPSAVRNITAWAQRHGLVVQAPVRGDIFTYRDDAHCGIVTGADGARFATVEGNTSGRDGRTCWVAQHTRKLDETYWFVRWP